MKSQQWHQQGHILQYQGNVLFDVVVHVLDQQPMRGVFPHSQASQVKSQGIQMGVAPLMIYK